MPSRLHLDTENPLNGMPLVQSATCLLRGFSMSDEVWLPVVGYERIYEVSDLGRIKYIRFDRVMKLKNPDNHGYARVQLYKDKIIKFKRLHQIVMDAFVGPDDRTINHIDGNCMNNALANLEYVSMRENLAHRSRNRKLPIGVCKKGERFYAELKRDGGRKHLGAFSTAQQAYEAYRKESLLYGPNRYLPEIWPTGENNVST